MSGLIYPEHADTERQCRQDTLPADVGLGRVAELLGEVGFSGRHTVSLTWENLPALAPPPWHRFRRLQRRRFAVCGRAHSHVEANFRIK